MKKLLLAALAIFGLAVTAESAPLYGYVQITTTTALTPPLQSGAINVSSGSIRNLNVKFGVAAATGAFTGTVTAGTFSPASALSPILAATNTWTAGQTFASSTTYAAAIVVSSNVIAGSSQGTAGQSLQSNAGSAPSWVNVPSAILTTTSTWTANQTISSATVSTLNSSAIIVTTITPTGIVGTTTNNAANSGNYGEYVSSVSISSNVVATGNYGDQALLPLSAGDWEVTLFMRANAAGVASVTVLRAGISTTNGNSTAGLVTNDNQITLNVSDSNQHEIAIPCYRMSLSGGTTVYAKAAFSYSGTVPQTDVRLSARRMR